MDGIERVPDHLRCRRSDGKRWRCPRLALQHASFCDVHQVQARRRQYKLPVPDSLKLRHARRDRLSTSVLVAPGRSHVPKKRKMEKGGEEEEKKRRNADGEYLVSLMRMMAWRRKSVNEEDCEDDEDGVKKIVPAEESGVRVQTRTIRTKKKQETFKRMDTAGIKSKNGNAKRKAATRKKSKVHTKDRKETTIIKGKVDIVKRKETTGIKRKDETRLRDTSELSVPNKKSRLRLQSCTRKRKEYSLRVKEDPMVSSMPAEDVEMHHTNASPLIETSPLVSEECLIDVPDHLRCRRNDGKHWRCRRKAMENHCFCELHHIQQYRRQYKLGVPESLKLKRKPRAPIITKPQVMDQMPKERVKNTSDEEVKRADDKVKRRKKIESLLVELMRMVLKRLMERREKEEMRKQNESMEVMRKLPNGLMAISPVSNVGSSFNGDHQSDRKLHLDPSSLLRWCFRSKNVESPYFGTVKKFPNVNKTTSLVKHRKKVCHHCQNSGMCGIVPCSSCRRVFFCKACIKNWYSELSADDVKEACPICRGDCRCAACLPGRLEESNNESL